MKANKLLLAARHARASGAPIETAASDTSEGQQMTPAAVQLPFKAELPSLGGATAWLNSPPLSVADLGGKVVLIDFWTYTCINWLRTLPYVRTWAEKYQEHGVVVIGVHTPEFSFEHDLENVRRAAQDMRVAYPIAIDNDYAIWHAFTNHYWPALYLVDVQGHLRYHHFGEGAYEQSEMILQHVLAEAGIGGIAHELVSVDAQGAEAAADWGDCRLYAWHGDGDPLPLLRYGAHPRGAGQGTLLAGYARRACPSNEGRVVEVAYYEAGPFSLSRNVIT
jgi:thiol-disulfide isomerase/thioredoxin